MRVLSLSWAAAVVALMSSAQAQPASPAKSEPAASPAGAPGLTSDDQKIVYAVGLVMARQLGQFDLSPAELEIVKRALSDSAAGKPGENIDEWGPKIQSLVQTRSARVAQREKTKSAEFLVKAAAEPGATKTDSGLIYKELTPGTGATPKATDTVKVNYRGTFTNNTEFDSSYKRNQPAQFPLNGVIKCWTEGVQKMKVGGKARLVCPSEIAYGDQGRGGIPGGATLVFEIELLEISQTPQPAAK
jgi:FKBP-type peptidyl-prolyl cis-trans isomerase FkpA